MESLIVTIMFIGWIIGLVLAILVLIYSFVKRDKNGFETGFYLLIIFGLTGYITFFPITIAILIINRFG